MARKKKSAAGGLAGGPQQIAAGLFFLAVLLGVGFYLFLYGDWEKELNKKSGELKVIGDEIRSLEASLKELEVVEAQAQCLRLMLADLDRQLPSSADDLNEFLDSLDHKAQRANLRQILKLEQLDVIREDRYTRVPVRVEFISDYNAATDFFWALSQMGSVGEGEALTSGEQLVDVKEFEIARDDRLEDGLVGVNCLLETYLFDASQLAEQPQGGRR